jgi:hypothetical protein
MIEKGIYRHFKGKEYEVIGQGTHTETREIIVMYRQLYGSKEEQSRIYLRPLKMFEEEIVYERVLVKRLEKVKE